MRTAENIKKDIEDVKKRIFLEEMADFMDWSAYRSLNKELHRLEKELEEVVSDGMCRNNNT